MIKRIAITGPESTGKSWLAEHLAQFYQTSFAPEYSRTYLSGLQRRYTYDDILAIAKGQRQNEIIAGDSSNLYLFCDTESLITKIWSEHAFGRCDPWIDNEITNNPHDFYLLCNIDLPWEPDPLREHPELRDYLFDLYKKKLTSLGLPFGVVSGLHEDRLNCAINILSARFE